jgi:hypothetical protein
MSHEARPIKMQHPETTANRQIRELVAENIQLKKDLELAKLESAELRDWIEYH